MTVLDASVVVELLLRRDESAQVRQRVRAISGVLHAPHLIDVEVLQAMRRISRADGLTSKRAAEFLADFGDLRILRHRHGPFRGRIWELRQNLTAYDAAYVALAERLDAPLLTRDARLASASGHQARVELV